MWYFRTTIRTRINNSKKLTVPVHVLKLQTMTRKNAEGVLLLLFFRGTEVEGACDSKGVEVPFLKLLKKIFFSMLFYHNRVFSKTGNGNPKKPSFI